MFYMHFSKCSKCSFICTFPTDRIAHTTAFVTPAWTRNSSMGSHWRIDPTTHRTMSERSYHWNKGCQCDIPPTPHPRVSGPCAITRSGFHSCETHPHIVTDPPPPWRAVWTCLGENPLLFCLQTRTRPSVTRNSVLHSSDQGKARKEMFYLTTTHSTHLVTTGVGSGGARGACAPPTFLTGGGQ